MRSRDMRETSAAVMADKSGNKAAVVVSPYPSPELVRQYAALQPDAADRILKIVEREQEADIAQQRREEAHDFALRVCGLASTVLLCLAAMVGGVLLILRGHAAGGWVSLVTALAVVFTVIAKGGRQ